MMYEYNIYHGLKSKPRAKQYRTHGLVHYQLLEEIFNTTTATGQLRYASNQLPPNSDEELELENNFLNTSVYIDVDLDDDGVNLETDHVMSQRLQTIQKKKSVEASSTSNEMYSIEECIGIVEEIGDIDNDTFNKMVGKIVLIEWRKIFFIMSDARRRAWLASL
ncbi:hypothetical protein L3X38_033788 [Prunus dulcis]|uniref:Uncharacterized protein n=1 Tax=Prunus dulcis TaxID=3755 RepID=A0AAD4YX90_PRUDU|nr:hypothetical protein L3X38_033788 [Prunus dulcis]